MLTDLWYLLPERLLHACLRLLGWDTDAVHEYICAGLGCRCPE